MLAPATSGHSSAENSHSSRGADAAGHSTPLREGWIGSWRSSQETGSRRRARQATGELRQWCAGQDRRQLAILAMLCLLHNNFSAEALTMEERETPLECGPTLVDNLNGCDLVPVRRRSSYTYISIVQRPTRHVVHVDRTTTSIVVRSPVVHVMREDTTGTRTGDWGVETVGELCRSSWRGFGFW